MRTSLKLAATCLIAAGALTTQPAFANLYPGCQPMNLFDPGGPSVGSYEYVSRATWWNLTQVLDDLSGSIRGGLGFGLPAGEISAALSGEMRWHSYTMASQFLPTDFVDCTGLRMCLANGNVAPSLRSTINGMSWPTRARTWRNRSPSERGATPMRILMARKPSRRYASMSASKSRYGSPPGFRNGPLT